MPSPKASWQIPALAAAAILIAGCSKQPEPPTKMQLLSNANRYFADSQYENAAAGYRRVLRLDPSEETALRNLGEIHFAQGQYRPALLVIKRLTELQPNDVDAQVKLGQIYATSGALLEARDTLLAALERRPGDEDALIALINTAVTPDDLADIETAITNLRSQDSDRPGYHLAVGELAMRRKDLLTAEREFRAADRDVHSSSVNFALANLAWVSGDLSAADQAFRRAIELAPLRSYMRFKYVDFKLATGDRAAAKSVLEDIRRQIPDDLPASVYLMKLSCADGPRENCTESVRNILARDPDNDDAILIDGQLSLAAGDTAGAIKRFELVNRINLRNVQARFQLAAAYLLNQQDDAAIDKAVDSLNAAVNIDAHYIPANLLLSDLRMRKGQHSAAIDLLTQVINDSPETAQAYILMGRAYLAQQNKERALATYRRMAELLPKDPQAPLLAGLLLLDQRQVQQARNAFERSLDILPTYLPAIERLVDLDITDKRYASAVERVRRGLAENQTKPQLWAIKAKIELAQQNFSGAESDLLHAIDLDPQFEPAYLLLARLYVASRQEEKAIAKLSAFAKNNNDVAVLMELAIINERTGHLREAGDAYQKVISINPRVFAALNNLAVIYAEQPDRLIEAYNLARRAREVAPEDPSAADTLGWILFKKGEYRAAISLLKESAAKLPAVAAVQFHLGMAHYMIGEDDPARRALRTAADASERFVGQEEASVRLRLLDIDATKTDPAAWSELQRQLQKWPNDPAVMFRFAKFQERNGAADAAMKGYERIVNEHPQYAPAIQHLAILYSTRGNDDQRTAELLVKARQINPTEPTLAKAQGILEYRRGLYAQSRDILKSATSLLRDDAELEFYLGMTYYYLSQSGDAQKVLNHALELKLSDKLAAEARRALADCCQKEK
jgi:tetratricopeptide (TPR) repeat protein